MEEIYKQILKKFKEELDTDKNADFIEVLFQERSDTLRQAITKNHEYQNVINELNNADVKIENKFDNGKEIIFAIGEHEEKMCEAQSVSEKLMYQYGVVDGMRLMMSVLKNNNGGKIEWINMKQL